MIAQPSCCVSAAFAARAPTPDRLHAPPMSDLPMIRVVDAHKRFGTLEVLKGVSFDVHRGSVVSMIGASGSGKSTLLRCINHLEVPSAGDIFVDGESLCFRGAADGDRRPRSLTEINRIRRDLGI